MQSDRADHLKGSHMRRYTVRAATSASDLRAAQALRGAGFGLSAPDIDPFDDICTHMLVEDQRLNRLAGCFRLLPLTSGAELRNSMI